METKQQAHLSNESVSGYRNEPQNRRSDTEREELDPRTEMDRIADEIAEWCPSQTNGIQIFQKRTGVDLKTARDIMKARYKNRPKGVLRNDICPRCGSRDITYEKEADRKWIQKSDLGSEEIIRRPGQKVTAKCQSCRMKWEVK